MKAIVVKNLCFQYNNEEPLIDNLSFEIEQGDYVVIVGKNGSGKSTLAKLLTGIIKPTSGEIYINEEKVENKYVNPVSIVFQNPDNQFVATTVEEDIAFGLENKCVDRQTMERKVIEFAKKVHMEKFLKTEPSHLSGGQKQRVALAGVLVLDNEILILDEATSMLDPKGRNEVNALIEELRETNPKLTVISITHDMNQTSLCNKLMVLKNGALVAYDEPRNIFKSDDEYLQHFMPFINKVKIKLNESGFDIKSENFDGIIEELCQLK